MATTPDLRVNVGVAIVAPAGVIPERYAAYLTARRLLSASTRALPIDTLNLAAFLVGTDLEPELDSAIPTGAHLETDLADQEAEVDPDEEEAAHRQPVGFTHTA